MSIIPEVVLIGQALGSLTKFFVDRFDRQAELLKEDRNRFRREAMDHLGLMAEDDALLKKYVRAATDSVENLVGLRNVVEGLEKASEISEVRRFYETYCQHLLFLKNLELDYHTVVTNFSIKFDYRNELDLQLLDYHSDLALLGLHVLESSEHLLADDNGDLDFKSMKAAVSLAYLIDGFLTKAMTEAEGRTGDWRETHSKYVSKIRYYFDYRFTFLLTHMGTLAVEHGICGYAALSYSRAKNVEERLKNLESDPELKKYHHNQNLLMEMLTYKAIAFAWLERFKSEINKLSVSLTPTSIKGKVGAYFKDTFGGGAKYSPDAVRREAKNELKNIEKMCEEFGITLDEEPEGLKLPDLEQFQDDLRLPEIHWRPAPLPTR